MKREKKQNQKKITEQSLVKTMVENNYRPLMNFLYEKLCTSVSNNFFLWNYLEFL